MTTHDFRGLTAQPLLKYLAALGLSQIVGQADPQAVTWWRGDRLHMDTVIEDVPAFLVEAYRPTPVFSPWSGGSGFGEKDRNQRAAIEKLAKSDSPRLAGFGQAHQAVLDVLARRDASELPWPKERLIVELRNRLPVESLRWLDAAIVLGDEKLHFPAVYGTGGNDGRLDFSSNFHQRLAEVLPEVGAKPTTSLGWASDALTGEHTTRLVNRPVGQYDPLGARSPGTWTVGAGQPLVNPWYFILMIEACAYLAASLARAGQSQPRAAVPFTVTASAYGGAAGSVGSTIEGSRGEFWAPLWGKPLQHRELRQLFEQSQASWAGRAAATSSDMFGAAKSQGVDTRISAFYRYAMVQRNGLAFVAAPRERVLVRPSSGIAQAIPVEARMARLTHATSAHARAQINALVRSQIAFKAADDEHVASARLIDWLAALTAREHSAALSEKERDAIRGLPPSPSASDLSDSLTLWLGQRAEHRLAACLASGYLTKDKAPHRPVTLRTLIIGSPPGRESRQWRTPVVAGYGVRPLDGVLADVAVWRDHHPKGTRRGAGRGVQLMPGHRYRCRRDDVTRWVRGELDERVLAHAFAACLAIDWTSWPWTPPPREMDIPDPTFAILSAVASGQIVRPGFASDDRDQIARQAFPTGWALRLQAGHVRDVVTEAAALINRSRFEPSRAGGPENKAEAAATESASTSTERAPRSHPDRYFTVTPPLAPAFDTRRGVRLVAALLAPASVDYLAQLDPDRLSGLDASAISRRAAQASNTGMNLDQGALA